MAETIFILAPNAHIAGTHLIDEVELSPSFLVACFGAPAPCDELKVSGEYRFVTPRGEVFTVHDWKVTSLYQGESSDAPTPEEFWAGDEPYHFSIGGRGEYEDGSADAFIDWLLAEQAGWRERIATT